MTYIENTNQNNNTQDENINSPAELWERDKLAISINLREDPLILSQASKLPLRKREAFLENKISEAIAVFEEATGGIRAYEESQTNITIELSDGLKNQISQLVKVDPELAKIASCLPVRRREAFYQNQIIKNIRAYHDSIELGEKRAIKSTMGFAPPFSDINELKLPGLKPAKIKK